MEESATSSIWTSVNSWFTSTVFFVLLNLMIATIVFTSNLPNNNHHQQQQEEEQEIQNPQHHTNQPKIARSPSILHRLRSINFYPQKSQHESSPDTQYHQNPYEVAATQYVFNQSLDYQHFDSDSTETDHTLNQFQENVTAHYEFDPTRQENGEDIGSDFDQIRQDSNGDIAFDFEPAADEHADEFQSLDEVYSKLKSGRHDRTKSEVNIRPKSPLKMKKSASLKAGFSHLDEEDTVEARRPATVREKKPSVGVAADDDVDLDSRADDFINRFKNDLKLQRIESIMRTKGTTNRGTGK
ncbi:hypothetical protein E3N88_27271 [Mikania micrantha]|uniref:DUF4408 domain-containing protein n=1 Tax=Mikania micrantha TaxID=192012 RepID=A0A5N6MXB8_9ASTR|nr:hypothetical protein E3N88_27271 [Mikania micrantha]